MSRLPDNAADGSRIRHLTRRFAGSLRVGPPAHADRAWVAGVLSSSELVLFLRMSNADRRHAVEVARRVESSLAGTPEQDDPRWPAAALLHDVGKIEAGLGVAGRVVATVLVDAVGEGRVRTWATRPGFRGRLGRYADYPRRGARLLRDAGAAEEVAGWAAAHHDPAVWPKLSIPPPVVRALAQADEESGD